MDDEGIRFANAVTYLELTLIVPAVGYALGDRVGQGRALPLRAELSASTVVAGLGMWVAYGARARGARPRRGRAGRGGPGDERRHRHRRRGRSFLARAGRAGSRLAGAVLVAIGVALLGF